MPVLINQQKKKRYIPKLARHEQNIQRMVCTYLRRGYPDVIFRSDFASGLRLTPHQAATHKSLQSSRSFPDLFIYKPSRGYYGLALELKSKGTPLIITRGPQKGHLTADPHIREQVLLLRELKKQGYYGTIAVGYEQAKAVIDWYFNRVVDNGSLF